MTSSPSRTYLIVGGSPEPSSSRLVAALAGQADRTIAVDRGAEVLMEAQTIPWAFVGDADSIAKDALDWVQQSVQEIRRYPVLKDATDLTLALDVVREEARQKGESPQCLVSCVSGGRIDHQLGVVGVLARARELKPVVVENAYLAWLLSPEGRSELLFEPSDVGQTISVISLSERTCVSEKGVYWKLDRARMGVLDDLGVSNVITSSQARILCHEGLCLVVKVGSPWLRSA